MARINRDLLQAIADKLGITASSAYRRVEAVVRETYLEREDAALVVASRLRININRYSTPAQRERVRGYVSGSASSAPTPPPPTPAAPAPRNKTKPTKAKRNKDNTVFVIGGRDTALTESMYQLLSSVGCKPVEFHQAVAKAKRGNPYIGDVLDRAFEEAQGLVVIFSPDDEVRLKDQFLKSGERHTEGRYQGQPRPNVIFEAGMAMAHHQDKTIMVAVGRMKSFTDISGRHLVHLDDSTASRRDFLNRLSRICKIDDSGSRWVKVGTFVPKGPKPARGKKRR